ncbi:MAG: chromosome segregation protein SMC [Armatimonadetes bacterium]|nr:chromosome segregation protein SMC [Armatimonadota bacterium]
MRLLRVRINGFKTFAEKTEFTLDGGFIAVVGPNGCGKSNLVDAILWGLGEGNSRHLRAATAQDVIFGGSSRRKAVSLAEVHLTFDNSDGGLPIGTSEVTISRRVTRGGDSAYAINRVDCRLRDIHDLLADSGLGRSGYAIVGQKEIDQALAASAEDRRAWIDEAAGVQRYRARKTESLRRLAQAKDHLQRIEDILSELESQREPLREEAEVAQRYRSVADALREIDLGLWLHELKEATREIDVQEQTIASSARAAADQARFADEIEAAARRLGEEIGDVESDLDTIRSLQQANLSAMERAEAEIRLADERLASLDQLECALRTEAEATDLAQLQKELEDARAEAEEARSQLEVAESTHSGSGSTVKGLTASLAEKESELRAARDAEQKRTRLLATAQHQQERSNLLRRELEGAQRGLPDLVDALDAATSELDQAQAALNLVLERKSTLEGDIAAARKKQDQSAEIIRGASHRRAVLDGRRRGIEATIAAHEGMTQGARAVIEAVEKGLLKDHYLPVGEAIETPVELAQAIEVALGAAVNDLIVDTDVAAKRAVEYLKSNRLGRATFQPIPLMRASVVSPDLRRVLAERGVVGRASDLLSYDERVRPVVESLLGRVVIVDDLDVALRLAKSSGWSRLVTLSGEVVHGSGAVTGGTQAKAGIGIVQRKAELASILAELDDMEAEVERARLDAEDSNRSYQELIQHVDALSAEERDARKSFDEAKDFHRTLQNERQELERSLQKIQSELSQLADANVEVGDALDLAPLEEERDRLMQELAAAREAANRAGSELEGLRRNHEAATERAHRARRRMEAATETEEKRGRRLELLDPERAAVREARARHEEAKAVAATALAAADARLAQAQERRKDLLQASLEKSEEARAARANLQSLQDTSMQAEIARARWETKRANAAQRLIEDFSLEMDEALAHPTVELPADAASTAARLRREMKSMGVVNLGAIEAYERLSERLDELTAQHHDVSEGAEQVRASIAELDKLTRTRFVDTFGLVQTAFSKQFDRLFGGGSGELRLSDPENVLESGIEIDVTLPGKKRQPLGLLSGGERSLCATAFLFSLLEVKPSPLVVLDEVDAPLDGRNVERFADLLRDFSEAMQFIVITHNPSTIERADVWLGVTMQEPGVSTLVPARFADRKVAAELVERVSKKGPESAPALI